jgi:hypothetical protein
MRGIAGCGLQRLGNHARHHPIRDPCLIAFSHMMFTGFDSGAPSKVQTDFDVTVSDEPSSAVLAASRLVAAICPRVSNRCRLLSFSR